MKHDGGVVDIAELLTDLADETADLDALIAPLTGERWHVPTPAEGWDIEQSVTHLMRSDAAGLLALDGGDLMTSVEGVLNPSYSGDDLRGEWLAGAAALNERLADLPPGVRIPWYGPAMSQISFVTARIMETWAHGQDIADALGATRTSTDRLRHICEIGVRTRGWSYLVRARSAPETPVRVELTAPDGSTWSWGPAADERITGTAEDFALLVTQRRHRDDLGLAATGKAADEWLSIAQAFAGPPGPGRSPRGMAQSGGASDA